MSNSLWPHGLYSSWTSPGQNTGVGSLSLLQGMFPTQGSNPGLLHYRQILYQLSSKGSPNQLTVRQPKEWYPGWVGPNPVNLLQGVRAVVWAPGTSFLEDNFSTDGGVGGFGDDSRALHLLHNLFLLFLHQLHLRSSGIRPWRLARAVGTLFHWSQEANCLVVEVAMWQRMMNSLQELRVSVSQPQGAEFFE